MSVTEHMKKTGFYNIRTLAMLALLCLFFQPVISHAKGSDVVLILDASGSMAASDAQNLRKEAAKMFVALMQPDDRVAVMRFSGRAQLVTPLNKLADIPHKNRVISAIERVSSRGAWTDIHQALTKGHALLKQNRRASREQIIILMSDGKMDVGDQQRDARLTEQTLGPLTQKLAQDRIKVHSIAFTNAGSLPLLQLASQDTKGFFTVLKGSSGIHEVFETLFERSARPDMLPLHEDSFIVDKSIREMTIVVSKYKPNSRIALEAPDGKQFTSRTIHPGLHWVKAKQYDLISLKNPTSGYWRIKFSEGGNRAYVYTDLKMMMEAATEVSPGVDFELYVWMEKNAQRVNNNTLVNATRFVLNITHPDGKHTRHVLKKNKSKKVPKGVLSATLAFSQPGTYKLELTGKNDAFDRKKSHFINVVAPINRDPFKVMDPDSPEPVSEAMKAEAEARAADEAAAKAAAEKAAAERAAAEQEAAEKAAAEAKNMQTSDDGAHIEDSKPEDAAAEDNGGKKAMAIFLVINTILGIGALLFFLWRKLRGKSGGRQPRITDDVGHTGIDLADDDLAQSSFDAQSNLDDIDDLDDAGLDDDVLNQDFDDIDLDEIDEEGAMEADLDTTLGQTEIDEPREAS